ncbi:MAG: porphobilinogen synthase [Pseudomonadota bacterium]
MFPVTRLRRNRKHAWLRDLVAESNLRPEHLIYPVFVIEGEKVREEIGTMPGVFRLSIDQVIEVAEEAAGLGIKALALFPVVAPGLKSEKAEEAYNPGNLVCRTIKALRASEITIGIICDVALDPYTSHGHDGIMMNGDVDNDETIKVLCRQALALSAAGTDIIAPSDMMDGRVGKLREALDEEGYEHVCILAYSAKYASKFYGPFRDALGSSANLKKSSKATYQMDPRNGREAMREVELDTMEGADMVMIKPGMPYLDVVRDVVLTTSLPVFVYQVSGEYAMLKHAAIAGCFDFEEVMIESLISFRRAGATAIFTYAALEIARKLHQAS